MTPVSTWVWEPFRLSIEEWAPARGGSSLNRWIWEEREWGRELDAVAAIYLCTKVLHGSIKFLRISADMTSRCMPYWYRSACLLGNPAVEDSIRRELDRRFPSSTYPVNIDVLGRHDRAYATVRITNYNHGINVSEEAHPEDFELDTLAAVIDTTNHVIAELEHSGKLRKI